MDSDEKSNEIILSTNDGWWRLQQLFPEFSEHKADAFPCGTFWPGEKSNDKPCLVVRWVHDAEWSSENYAKDIQKIRNLKIAIGFPEDIPMMLFDNDF